MLADHIDSICYPILPVLERLVLERLVHEAEKAAQHLRVHLNFDRVM